MDQTKEMRAALEALTTGFVVRHLTDFVEDLRIITAWPSHGAQGTENEEWRIQAGREFVSLREARMQRKQG